MGWVGGERVQDAGDVEFLETRASCAKDASRFRLREK